MFETVIWFFNRREKNPAGGVRQGEAKINQTKSLLITVKIN